MTHKPREPRIPVSVSARLNYGESWDDVHIKNVSSRGLMGIAQNAPKRGDYVEIRRGYQVIIGRVAWSTDGKFGVLCRDKIDLEGLQSPERVRKKPDGDRRQSARVADDPDKLRKPNFAAVAEASRRLSRAMDFVFVSAGAVLFCFMVANLAYEALSKPLGEVKQALASPNTANAAPVR